LISKISSIITSFDLEENLEHLIGELKKEHPIFQKLSYRCLKEMLRLCDFFTIRHQNLYTENENSEGCYILLYGHVFLKNKTLGVFTESFIGDTLAEEAILENNFTKKETAQVLEEAGFLEISGAFLDKLQHSPLKEDYQGILSILKKNYKKKKNLRTLNIFS